MKHHDLNINTDLALIKSFLDGQHTTQIGLSALGMVLQLFESEGTLWFDDDHQLCACTQIKADARSWRVQIHPDHYTDDLFITILHHAEAQLGAQAAIHTVAYGRDTRHIDLLANNGYVQSAALDVYMQRALDNAIPAVEAIPGFVIREFAGEREIAQRASAQGDSFTGDPEPNDWVIQNTRRMMDFQPGRPDIDLVAVSDDGVIASYAYCIIGPVTRIGEFDPVGTRHAFQRRGLAQAVMLEGLRRMRVSGMQQAVVRTQVTNKPAIALYERVGFEVVDYLYRYTKVRP